MAGSCDERYSRACGCLIGWAVGEAMGAPYEPIVYRGLSPEEIGKQYGVVVDLPEGATITDDMEFSLLVAHILQEHWPQITSEAVADEWLQHLDLETIAKGTISPVIALRNLKKGKRPPISGEENVFGWYAGAVMRVAPIGITCAGDTERAASIARADAIVSHHTTGVEGAMYLAATIATAMVTDDADEVVQKGMEVIPEGWVKRCVRKAGEIANKYQDWQEAREELYRELKTDSLCAATDVLPFALAAFKIANGDFRQAVIAGVNFWRDPDTVPAIAGALIGAMKGVGIIPEKWVERVETVRCRIIPSLGLLNLKEVALRLTELNPS